MNVTGFSESMEKNLCESQKIEKKIFYYSIKIFNRI